MQEFHLHAVDFVCRSICMMQYNILLHVRVEFRLKFFTDWTACKHEIAQKPEWRVGPEVFLCLIRR